MKHMTICGNDTLSGSHAKHYSLKEHSAV